MPFTLVYIVLQKSQVYGVDCKMTVWLSLRQRVIMTSRNDCESVSPSGMSVSDNSILLLVILHTRNFFFQE